MFSKWFKKEVVAEKPALPSPYNLRLKAAVDIDPIPFAMISDKIHFVLPAERQIVEAQGKVDLGGGAYLSRYYTSDDAFIQVSTTAGFEEQHVDDIKLFVFEDTIKPANQAEWEVWTGKDSKIGDATYTFNGVEYTRVWMAQSEGSIVPVEFEEEVTNLIEGKSPYTVIHLAMLYERLIPQIERYEYLLISAEHTHDDANIVFSLGVDLDPQAFIVT